MKLLAILIYSLGRLLILQHKILKCYELILNFFGVKGRKMYTFRVLIAIYDWCHYICQVTDEKKTSVYFGEYQSTFCSVVTVVTAMFY